MFGMFLVQMKSKYRRSFFSWQTGAQMIKGFFLEGNTDEEKASIVKYNRHMWESIRPQVRVWFHDNWKKWEEEKRAEELKAEQEAAAAGKDPKKAKAPPPKKGGKDAGVFQYTGEKL